MRGAWISDGSAAERRRGGVPGDVFVATTATAAEEFPATSWRLRRTLRRRLGGCGQRRLLPPRSDGDAAADNDDCVPPRGDGDAVPPSAATAGRRKTALCFGNGRGKTTLCFGVADGRRMEDLTLIWTADRRRMNCVGVYLEYIKIESLI
nr:hypothetical protein Iba_chr08bCG9620 [Ipomoea batatas]